MADGSVEVFVQLAGEDVPAGRMWTHRQRGGQSATFAYLDAYLQRADAYALDPALPLYSGQQQTPQGRALFGAFSDAAPDGWGRRLLRRSELAEAREHGRAERDVAEIDHLLGVRDDLRQGALRFRHDEQGGFLANEPGEARMVLGEVSAATSGWRETAKRTAISAASIQQLEPAFEHGQAEAARSSAAESRRVSPRLDLT